ncbi:FtsX-like permease family protein [Polaromonas sp.]|nr:FtsX-like permease family protein [Candidatus Saccharibacteria bacterium]
MNRTNKRKLVTFGRIITTGMTNFIRNASLAAAAIAVMVVTLTIVLFSLIANATFTNTIAQITNKIDISVYLKDSATKEQQQAFVKSIKKLPDVASVSFLSKDQALQSYIKDNAKNPQLLQAINATDNPLPATIKVKPRNLNQIGTIKNFLVLPANAALQTADSPSYNGDRKQAIDTITHATNVLRTIGIASVIIFTIICALIIFNTIQMAIFNRRDELTIMRLLGASTSYIRGPFVVESAIYGVLSAILSMVIINAAFIASSSALQATSLGLLDINFASDYFGQHFLQLLGLQLLVGILIGIASSTIATRRYLKFKTK